MTSQPASPGQRLRGVAAVIAALLVAGCAGTPPAPATAPPRSAATVPPVKAVPARTAGEQAAIVAVRQIGVPYRYGGTDSSGFDCSGLVHFAWAAAGKRIPRTTRTLWNGLDPVRRTALKTGDILFFRISGKMSHVGLYLGDGRFVHAPSSGREVTVAALDSPFYRKAFIRAGRP